ncbi:glycosyl transferase group 1 [Deinococcus phoenicis]|uniref:Glycosyl transferase group 1 n=1 Tax=Deinococcus phoenicis TaxID=1476583 RepID=A0A016QTU5_9DEIO|nr:glycosyltransferase [Deinococcus phoenicis]EYB69483.1 glycosyl transferase group 1 [Deinococcus phoenicis]
MTRTRPLRVLHLTGPLNRGGIETWLVNLLGQVDRQEIEMDVMTLSRAPETGSYDAQVRALGASLIPGPPTRNLLTFVPAFLRLLRRHGPYDVVHSHVHHFGGLALLLARLAGVPTRVSTSHSDTRRLDAQARNGRYAYLTLMRAAMRAGVTHRLAVSAEAASLYGPDWRELGTEIVRLGIDLRAFRQPVDRLAVRAELHLPAGEPVVGHVGRLRPEKNQAFLLDVFAAYLNRHGPAQLLLVGDGEERAALEAHARALGLSERVHLLGSRPDVPRLLQAMDVFVFPSTFEGLSLALLEAQAAGLPCVVSADLTAESRVPGVPYFPVDLAHGPPLWADTIAQALAAGRGQASRMNLDIAENARALAELYRGAQGTRGGRTVS